MAGDWIKLRKDLFTDPSVFKLAAILKIDIPGAVGRVAMAWAWADSHATCHGNVTLVSRSCLDAVTGTAGFGDALAAVGWLEDLDGEDGGIRFPKFDRHMGEGAKQRAQAANRKQAQRLRNAGAESPHPQNGEPGHAHVTLMSRSARDGCVTREEKRREEKKEEELPSEVCSEPPRPATHEPTEPPVMTFPVTGKVKEWHLTPGKLAEYEQTYPALDVTAALRAARQWCIDNPAKRKTARGMGAFCARWLEGAVNRGQHRKGNPGTAPVLFRPARKSAADLVDELFQSQQEQKQ